MVMAISNIKVLGNSIIIWWVNVNEISRITSIINNIKNATWCKFYFVFILDLIIIETHKMYGCKWLREKIEVVLGKCIQYMKM
jgi:hypothetical protein